MVRRCILMVPYLWLMGWFAVTHAQQGTALPQWSPSPAMLKKLDAELIVEGYHVQPPKNYALVTPVTGGPEGVSSYTWAGAGRKDNTHPIFMVNLVVPPDEATLNLTLQQIENKLLAGIKQRRQGWTQTPFEAGTIQGLKFMRVGWTGTDRKEKRKMQGFMLVARDGDTIVQLASQDVVPYAAQALPLAEAAARTFRRPVSRVFYSLQWPDHAQVYSMNPDGSDRICLTPLTDSDYHPVLSPDEQTIAFTTHRDGMRSLYLMNRDGTNQRRVTQGEDAGLCAWSPDGSQLAFSSNRNGRYCIYLMNRDGTNVRKLTDGPSEDFPVWSPDGRQIAYEGMQDQKWRIFIVNVDGKGNRPITQGKWSDRWPQWSPMGDAILFTTYEHGNGDIALMNPNGTTVTRLTENPADEREPSWTAGGRQILFHSNRAGKFDIYVFDTDKGTERRLTTEPKDTSGVMTLGRSHFAPPH